MGYRTRRDFLFHHQDMTMKQVFEKTFHHVVMVEGGYSDHPSDTGGKTMYGITENVARANGYSGSMPDLPLETARNIYRRQYWDMVQGDAVAALSVPLAAELFDTAVNMGVAVAGKFLQRALNVLNRSGDDYQNIKVDGVTGPVTVMCLRDFLLKRGANGEEVMMRMLNAFQCVRYTEIAEANPSQEDFVYGWVLQRVKP